MVPMPDPDPRLRRLPALLFVALPLLLLLPVLRPGVYLFGGDFIAANYHVRGLAGKAFAEGRLPVWDSTVMCGTPLLAAMHAGVLYPLSWPLAFISPGPFWTLTVAIHLALAGAFAFAWLSRGLGVGFWGALTGALLFMLSGFVTSQVYLGHVAHVSTFPWAAAVLWRLERMLAGPTLRRGLLLAGVLAIMILAGFPQYVYILGFALLARLVQFVFEEKEGRKARAVVAAQAVAALAGSALLAAPQLLPTLEMVGQVQRGAAGQVEFASEFAVAPAELVTLVAPMYFGDNRGVPADSSPFVGIAGLLLGAVGLAGRSRQRWVWLGVAIFGLVMALGLHTPLFRLFYACFPGVRLFRAPGRYQLLFPIAMAPLAAFGVERLRSLDAGFWGRHGRKAAAGLGLVLVAELLGYNSRYFMAHPASDFEWPADFAATIKAHPQQPFRVASVTPEQIPTFGKCQLAGIDVVGGYESMMLRRYTELCNAGRGRPSSDVVVAMALLRPGPIFDLLGARIWMVPGARAEPPGWRTVGQTPDAFIYENPAALPRAFLVGRSVVIPTAEERLKFLSAPSFDPRRVVVLESGAPVDADVPQGSVRITSRKPNGYALESDCPAEAFLVLSETTYPGWTATIDGVPVEIQPADHLLQAVRVPAGRHAVSFEYRPRFLGLGFALAAFGLLVPSAILLLRKRAG